MSGGMVTTNVSGKADVVLTTKGDIPTFSTVRIRKAIGNKLSYVIFRFNRSYR